eukprot:scaffold153238_cov21-Tisochrysis_lutea.AAC.3
MDHDIECLGTLRDNDAKGSTHTHPCCLCGPFTQHPCMLSYLLLLHVHRVCSTPAVRKALNNFTLHTPLACNARTKSQACSLGV